MNVWNKTSACLGYDRIIAVKDTEVAIEKIYIQLRHHFKTKFLHQRSQTEYSPGYEDKVE